MKKLVLALVCATMILGIGGCTKEPKPSESVTGFIDAFKKQNQEEMNKYTGNEISKDDFLNFDAMDDSTMSESQKSSWDSLIKKMSEVDYTIKEEGSTDSDSSAVTISITTYDFGDKLKTGFQEAFKEAFTLAFDQSISEEEKNSKMTDTLLKNLNSAEKIYTKDIVVNLKKVEDTWKIDSQNNADLFDALSGGIMSTSDEINKSFSK